MDRIEESVFDSSWGSFINQAHAHRRKNKKKLTKKKQPKEKKPKEKKTKNQRADLYQFIPLFQSTRQGDTPRENSNFVHF